MSSVPSGLFRLVYYSRSQVAPGAFEPTIDSIIRKSIANNRTDGISGMLFCHDGWFLQALEGSHKAISATLARIEADHRHEAVLLLGAAQASGRLFREWDMCARTLSMVDAKVAEAIARRGAFDPGRLSLETATRLLTRLRAVRDDAQLRYVA
ncbi:hypothetical protein GVN21_13700 [Caulobacter sp. SLTY]|uniref:BLUF domain-containing protein n=1 Tax=Caulobacter sp. SLTY TaxID=2683262 RepID=UPI0014128441|nr:BLUF domain-containing protein [Caulobacter sp. SLTY]NBB16415.1 hypothetical protein [Caulobacter sp. SLTY]